jgi:hypothetical protein
MRVVEDDEAEKMLASGVWFDSPKKASEYRNKVEKEIAEEAEAKKPKAKLKEKDNEKSSNG